MKIKPSKSRSLSLRRGVRNDSTTFVVGAQNILLLSVQPIESLRKQFTAELSDKQMERDETALRRPGKYQPKPNPREVQGLVLPIHTLQESPVAAENE